MIQAKLVELYAIANRMRLFGEPQTLEEAERVITQIGSTYFAPIKEVRSLANMAKGDEFDLLLAFNNACRKELDHV